MKQVPSLAPDKLKELKDEYLGLLRGTGRDGIEDLIKWMENDTDFFTAPASTQFHGAYVGGLLVHSLAVYKYFRNFTKALPKVKPDTLIIAGLLHDLCKVNFFVRQVRNVKIPGEHRWEEQETFAIQDSLPMGHGEKSVYLAMKFIKLTDEEALAIRWHMGGYDDAARSYAGGKAQSTAFHDCPLAAALNIADMYVSHILNK